MSRLTLILFTLFGRLYILKIGHIWIFYALVIIFLGGIIVVFVYSSSLSVSNKNTNKKQIYIVILNSIVIYTLRRYITLNKNYEIIEISPFNIYSSKSLTNLLFLATYLLLNLLILIKLVRWREGPLKTLN